MAHDEWLRSLPVPTPEQTARYADHVADSHSWYKHLPFFPPGASFVFFPNAYAGCGVNREGERLVVYDIEQGDYFAHSSRLPTKEYIAQFGHWDYWVVDNPRVANPEPGPWLYSGSHWVLLADDVKRQWSCRLTAFLKPAPMMFHLQAGKVEKEVEAFVVYAQANLSDQGVLRYLSVVGDSLKATKAGGSPALFDFMESEAREQRKQLLTTLCRVREVWVERRNDPAKPS